MPFFYATHRAADRIVILGADARHLAGPLRARVGERIAVVDAEAGELLAVRLDSVSAREVVGTVVEARAHQPEPTARVTMAIAMLPAVGLEHILSRCTELGAAGFILIQAERSVARGAKPERWATICREAAMLAGRLVVPAVTGPITPAELARRPEVLMLHQGADRRLVEVAAPADVTLAIGPEGGWSAAEVELLADRVVTLGPRVLRADTAAVTALAIALTVRGGV